MNLQKIAQDDFFSEVKDHVCTVLRADGVDRHLRFRRPGTIMYGFDIITWPGHLCITGDCGTYVFQRTHDMFEFFMGGSRSEKHPINTGYWAEKLLSVDRHGKVKEFSTRLFNEAVWGDFLNFARHGKHTPEQIREIRREIQDEILDPDNEHDAYHSVYSYSSHGMQFDDFYEHECKEYTHNYMWNLFAIVWGIEQWETHFKET